MKHTHLPFPLLIVSIFVWQLVITSTYAQWSTDLNVNNAICTSISDQTEPTIISDGSGGAIIVWPDYRTGTYPDIYAQRIDANGIIQWATDGIAVCTAADYQYLPTIVSDGSGGVIIAWVDNRYGNNYDIYAQRVDANGVIRWLADGVAVCEATNYQAYPTIVSDENGGAFIIWQDQRSGVNYDIYAQRINADGAAQWTADGVAICIEVGAQEFPKAISDGSGGAITTWNDLRNGNYDIYAQLIDSNGEVQWRANGDSICTALWEQSFPNLTGDGSGGAIITWEDRRNPPVDIYAQRIDVSGVVQWAADGVAISALAYDQVSPEILSDGGGGAIITWQVNSSGNDYDIFVQRIDTNGALQWTVNGMAICTADHHQQDPKIISDETGGAIITWEDQRSGTNYDIYAQRIDASSLVQWASNGVAISTATYDQIFPTLVSDGSSGAIITWQDYRIAYPDSVDIYAQQVNANGNLGIIIGIDELPILIRDFVLQQNYPNPFNPATTIKYQLGNDGFVNLKVFNALGQEVAELVNQFQKAGSYLVVFDAAVCHSCESRNLPSGMYVYKITAGNYTESKKMLLLK